MGKGPKREPAQETSRKSKLSARGGAGESGQGQQTAPDPCRAARLITIERDGAGVSVRDQIWLIVGNPPHAASAGGVIGPVRGPEARMLEACMSTGITFTGVVETVTTKTVKAVVEGR